MKGRKGEKEKGRQILKLKDNRKRIKASSRLRDANPLSASQRGAGGEFLKFKKIIN